MCDCELRKNIFVELRNFFEMRFCVSSSHVFLPVVSSSLTVLKVLLKFAFGNSGKGGKKCCNLQLVHPQKENGKAFRKEICKNTAFIVF